MLPQVFGLIRDLFEAHEMGKAFGVYGPVMGLSAMLGPIASGGLISANILGTGWRMIFLVNVPVGLVALVLGARILPAGSPSSGAVSPEAVSSEAGGSAPRRERLDLPGAVLAGVAMFGLVFPLAQGHALGWPGWLFGMFGASVLVLAGSLRARSARSAAAALRSWSRPSSGTLRTARAWCSRSCSWARWAGS